MENKFTAAEKRSWRLKKHIKDHAFEYALNIVLTEIFAYILLQLCRAEEILLGMAISFVWALGRVTWEIYYYKKGIINTDVK